MLSVDETELVEILLGILFASKGVRDMNKAWLAEAGLSPAPRGVVVYTAEKRPGTNEGAGLKKHSKRVTPEQGSPEAEVVVDLQVDRVWTEGQLAVEYLQVALHPILAKQLYECFFEELVNRVAKSAIWAELESSESRRKGLEEEVSLLRSNLDGSQDDRAQLEGDVLSLTKATAFLEVELKAEGPKVVAAYKASREFEAGLEKMGRINYEFGFRVALERLC
ncbi:hypothetical protein BHM03_00012090 [Ensete ventricosum]|nr:hypothetical protein BHM03_00012090 [Ensete ventricosum]